VLALKNRVDLKFFTVLKYFLSLRIFEQLALALKNSVYPEFTVLNIYFLSFRIFEQLSLTLKTEVALKFFMTGGGVGRLVRLCARIFARKTLFQQQYVKTPF